MIIIFDVLSTFPANSFESPPFYLFPQSIVTTIIQLLVNYIFIENFRVVRNIKLVINKSIYTP